MKARAAVLLWFLAEVAGAQTTIRPGGGGGSSTVTAGTTATSGCTDGGFLYSLTSLVRCGANAINDGTTVTMGAILARTTDYASGSTPPLTAWGSLTGNIFNVKNNAGTIVGSFDSVGMLTVGSATTSGNTQWKLGTTTNAGGDLSFGQVRGTFASTTGSVQTGVYIHYFGSGGTTNPAYVFYSQTDGSSGTSPALSYAGFFYNEFTGTDTATGNTALAGLASSSTTGTNTGVWGAAVNAGAGLKTGGSFSLTATRAAPAESSAGYFNNGAVAASIIVAADGNVAKWKIGDGGQPIYATTVPAVSNTSANSCGTTAATIAGTNETGIVTVGATSGTSCTLTFALAAPTRRQCIATNETSGAAVQSTYSSTTVSILAGTFAASDVISYICQVY